MGILFSTFFVRGVMTDTHFNGGGEMVGGSASSPANTRSARRSINFLEDRVGSKISPTLAPHGEMSKSMQSRAFEPIELPIEPEDLDEPIQCPIDEPSIMEDGKMWKERLRYRLHRRRRRVDSFTLTPSSREWADSIELVRVDQKSIITNTRFGNLPTSYHRSYEHSLLAPHSSPESDVTSRLLDDQYISA